MGKLIDLVGQKFGRLTVTGQAGRNKHRQLAWRCVCDCGEEATVLGFLLRQGQTGSCGCLQKETIAAVNYKHGMANSDIWNIHRSMMDRCHLPTSHAYSRYGGRGIEVCPRWHEFENFYADMGDKPTGLSLERRDNDANYEPENVYWATAKQQARNRRNTLFVEFRGETRPLSEWCEMLGLNFRTIWSRIKQHGYSAEEALTKPIGRWA